MIPAGQHPAGEPLLVTSRAVGTVGPNISAGVVKGGMENLNTEIIGFSA
jgi:hypothetical protein